MRVETTEISLTNLWSYDMVQMIKGVACAYVRFHNRQYDPYGGSGL